MQSGHIGVEIDDAAKLVMVAYIGPVTDQQVLAFYAGILKESPRVVAYDVLADLRLTSYVPGPGIVQAIGELVGATGRRVGRIAAVRRERPELYAATDGRPMREVFGIDNVRFFNDIAEARAWLATARTAAGEA